MKWDLVTPQPVYQILTFLYIINGIHLSNIKLKWPPPNWGRGGGVKET